MLYLRNTLLLAFLALLISCSSDEGDGPSDVIDPITPVPAFAMTVVNDNIGSSPIVIVGDKNLFMMTGYYRRLTDGTVLTFESYPLNYPKVMQDTEGNVWDIHGSAVEGPRTGQQLQAVQGLRSYWFATSAIFPGTDIAGQGETVDPPAPALPNPEWSIPTTDIFQGSGKDLIQSIDNPAFDLFKTKDYNNVYAYLQDDEYVTLVERGSTIKIYPHSVLAYHEIVNDQIGDFAYTVNFCPLVESSSVWNRTNNGQVIEWGVSGLLYNDDLIMYDRETDSHWLQLSGECIEGSRKGDEAVQERFLQMTWGAVKTLYSRSDSFVLSADQGFGYDYAIYPYGNYRDLDNLIPYPLNYIDTRLDNKDIVYTVIQEGSAKVFQLKDF